MADSLFDNRYRYDHIYPRGRSGETLRAVDTRAKGRAVIIKRPAPNDAPPIRAGQEVSILNERKALQRLAGHPVLTELIDYGQFPVGGIPQQYIVMERAGGEIIADMALALKARGQYLPELELLVIMDSLLDLLQAAHERDIVYNDVDAWHLFWEREAWQLKVIDWGNAVFLEGDESTAQGVSRQSDVAQAGELLYFLLTGGRRIDLPRDADAGFMADFGEEAERVPRRLQAIVSRAAHPRPRLRYAKIAELRKDLEDYRAPLQRERDLVLNRVSGRLRHDLSRDELNGLMQTLAPALAADPGYPEARELQQGIELRLQDIAIAADLDAIRIYMDTGNWQRSAELLAELRPRAGGETTRLVRLLGDMAQLLLDTKHGEVPALVQDSIALLFDGQAAGAAQELITRHANRREQELQHLLAERISAHFPDVQLLQPNLMRVRLRMAELAAGGQPVSEPQVVLKEALAQLEGINAAPHLSPGALHERYNQVGDSLEALQTLLDSLGSGQELPGGEGLRDALGRARQATRTLAELMRVIGSRAAASPREATAALVECQAIDPVSPTWALVQRRLDALYELLDQCQTWIPPADGAGLDGWLRDTRSDLTPFLEYFFDDTLREMVGGLEVAAKAWDGYAMATLQGNRESALGALVQAAEAVNTSSPKLAAWFTQLRSVVAGARYVERHALFGGLGRALADGWQTWDRGQPGEAARLAQRAREIARNNPQRHAAERLLQLAEATRGWVERNGVASEAATRAALAEVEQLYTAEELALRDGFTQQMPNNDTFLKAMNRGLIDVYDRKSTAALRVLFFNYVLLGTLDAHEDQLEDASFWQEAALRTLGDDGAQHVAARALEGFIGRRQDLLQAATLINEVRSPQALAGLEKLVSQMENSPQARALAPAALSLAELQAALRDWSDGEFRPAGIKLENAMNAVDDAEQGAAITLTGYRSWLITLQAGTAQLHTRLRRMQQVIEARPDTPDNALLEAHRWLVSTTEEMLGAEHGKTLRQWQETYEQFLATYIDPDLRRSERLARFNELFRAMFLDRHPAWPLYRHWFERTEQQPEFPGAAGETATAAVGTREEEQERSVPQDRSAAPEKPLVPFSGDDEFPELPESEPAQRLVSRRVTLGALAAITALILLLVLVTAPGREGGPAPVSATEVPAAVGSAEEESSAAGESPAAAIVPASPTALPASATPLPAPTATRTPAPTATVLPTATLPPLGLQGRQDLLALLGNLHGSESLPWSAEVFAPMEAGPGWRLGVGSEGDGSRIAVGLTRGLLETAYGNEAATRIRRMDVTLVLRDYNPALLRENAVWFGAALEADDEPEAAGGVRVRLAQPGVINLLQRRGEQLLTVGQRTVNAVVARLRLERDVEAETLRVYFNDEALGEPIPLTPGQALLPTLTVRRGGVVVSVTDWQLTLQPG